jgi:hypothetical protein
MIIEIKSENNLKVNNFLEKIDINKILKISKKKDALSPLKKIATSVKISKKDIKK